MPGRKFARKRAPMRRFKRRTGRKFKRRSFHKRDAPSRVVTKILGGFPDRYFCKLRVAGDFAVGGGGNPNSAFISWIGNSPLAALGPNYNNSGYSTQYASGVKYLIGNPNDQPASAPYFNGRVWYSNITVRYVPTAAGPSSLDFCVFPALIGANVISVSALNVVAEQPYVKTRKVVGNLTSNPVVIKSGMSSRKIFGIRYKGGIEGDISYAFNYNTAPVSGWYWNVYLFGDGATAITGRMEWEITYYCEFYGRNSVFSSSAPS